jgi:hypothetical protein
MQIIGSSCLGNHRIVRHDNGADLYRDRDLLRDCDLLRHVESLGRDDYLCGSGNFLVRRFDPYERKAARDKCMAAEQRGSEGIERTLYLPLCIEEQIPSRTPLRNVFVDHLKSGSECRQQIA